MRAIVWNHIQHLRHQPFAVLGMIFLTIVFASAVGQIDQNTSIKVPVYSEKLTPEESKQLIKKLNQDSDIHFIGEEKDVIEAKLKRHAIDVALQLEKDAYKLLVTADSQNVSLVEAHVLTTLQKEAALIGTADQLGVDADQLRNQVKAADQLFSVRTKSFKENDFIYDQTLQALFGFSLYFVMFTVSFTISSILEQKRNGMWNRLILSPLSKVQLYLGNLVFSFILGYFQVALIFTFFYYVMGVDLYGGFPFILVAVIPYLFALVSLGVFISALVTNPRQLDVIIPLVATSMAMIGGAYWPLEIVQSKVLLALSTVIPIAYGMEMLKGATILHWSLSQFLFPASVLFLMGVLFMGIGLNLMERKAM